MSETKELAAKFVDNYMKDIEELGLAGANAKANEELIELSMDMDSETADAFVEAVSKPINSILQKHIKEADKASEELTD